jgi:hypothetical protein
LKVEPGSRFSVLSSQFSVLSSQFSVLSSQFLVLGSRFSVLGSQFLVLSSQFLVLGSWFLVLGSRFSVLGSRFSVLGSQFPVLSSRFSVPGSQFSVPGFEFLVLGSWFLVLGSWFLVLGSWFLVLSSQFSVPGSQFSVPGFEFLVLGSWFLVLGSRFPVLSSRFAMPVSIYLSILRRRWLLVLTPAIIASVISLGVAFIEPPRYRSSADLLITRSEDRRFDTEDALAYDLPAIIKGVPFSIEISSALARTGVVLSPEQVRTALGASNRRRVVQIWAETGDPALSEALTAAAVETVQQRGLALWGDPSATPERTLVNVVVLAPPGPAVRTNDWRAGVVTAALRGLAGLVAGALLALGAYRWETARAWSDRATGG